MYHDGDGIQREFFLKKGEQNRSGDVVRKVRHDFHMGESGVGCNDFLKIHLQCIGMEQQKIILCSKIFFQDGNQLIINFDGNNEAGSFTERLRESADTRTDFYHQIFFSNRGKI